MKISINKIILLVLVGFCIATFFSSCGVFGKSKKDRQCMCPSRKVVG